MDQNWLDSLLKKEGPEGSGRKTTTCSIFPSGYNTGLAYERDNDNDSTIADSAKGVNSHE